MPHNELQRLQAVKRFLSLDLNKDKELQEIVELASELCETPIALITLITEDIQYMKYKVGTDLEQIAREFAFCNEMIEQEDMLVVPDTHQHHNFCNNPYVTGQPNIRFYAGAPLITHDGMFLGCLSVLDTQPRSFSAAHQKLLRVSAKRVIQIMEFDLSLKVLNQQYFQAKDSAIKLRSFFESSAECHLLIGTHFEVIVFNKNMAEFTQRVYGIKLYQGISINEVLEGEELNAFKSNYELALTGVPVSLERKMNYNGEDIWWAITYTPCLNADSEVIGVSYNARDITRHKLHKQQILDQNESLRNIAYVQSHELRKPVASIMGLMHIFEEEGFTASKEGLMIMKQAVNDLDTQIRKIVSYTEGVYANSTEKQT
ncbi:PAS domain S-box protein [Mucilaginibacter sp. Bleaf8]|uniref:GAF domain-containing protein n=1 Tax=Mucilaginibacter sp. Bleaf8 TaxID=2834430 RepID=UPI001BCC8377|nr:GAF domain-containing protein [Mucilaginibacter sp. Bleaf8]MBS7563525.1 PAS domain S-box protein [Mucilaginibacter sp. Bleaf8]